MMPYPVGLLLAAAVLVVAFWLLAGWGRGD